MFCDLSELRDFYETRLGRVVKAVLRRKLQAWWPSMTGECIVSLGYAIPLLRPLQQQTTQIFAIMPAGQGVIGWPREGPYRSALAYEGELPLPDNSVNALILMHAFEHTDNLQFMLEECWRVLTGNGCLVVIVPNRRSLWAHLERTPFGQGNTFRIGHIKRLLRIHRFTPIRYDSALYMPPFRNGLSLKAAEIWEKFGSRWLPDIAGVYMIEARKRLYAPIRFQKRRGALPALSEAVKPAVGASAKAQ